MSTLVRTPLHIAEPVAHRLANGIRPYCHRVELAGSLRRQMPTIGDIEIVAIPIRPRTLFGEELFDQSTQLDQFLDGAGIQFERRGAKFQQFRYGGYMVDLFLPTVDTWGSVFTIRTGSADFSRWLVTSQAGGGAKPGELAFNEGRLYARGRLLLTPEEEDVFAAVGLAWIDPRLRNGPISDPARIEPVWNYAMEETA